MHAVLLAGVVGLGVVGLGAVDTAALAAAAPAQTLQARLAPVTQAKRGSGSLTATGGSGQSVVVRWKLSVANLTGPVKRATLRTSGATAITFTLCQPCGAKAHGQFVLSRSMWARIVSSGGTVVVTTRAYPRGEVRGALKRV
jgi:hypothetical protein